MANRRSKQRVVFSAFADGAEFAFECQQVIALRLMRIAGGGGAARRETRRMITEKVVAATNAQIAAAAVLPFGLVSAANAASTVYKRAMRANRRRLTRKT